MGAMIRLLFPLIAYLCVATVLSLVLGFAYLRSNGTINDEVMFRIVALLHGIDMEKIADEQEADSTIIPPEENSYDQLKQQRQIVMRGMEAKQEDLKRDLEGFNTELQRITDARNHYDALRIDVETYLQDQRDFFAKEGPNNVRNQLEKLDPKKQAKPILLNMVREGRMDEVILLLQGMNRASRDAILKTFTEKTDLTTLRDIHRQMMSGEPIKPKLDAALQELDRLNGLE